MCDNELIKANTSPLLLYQQAKHRDAVDGCPLVPSSYCPLTDISFFAHNGWQHWPLWISNQNHAQFTSRFIVKIFRNVFLERRSDIEQRGCGAPAALAHTQMGRTTLADYGAFNYSDATSWELTCPLPRHSQYSAASGNVHMYCVTFSHVKPQGLTSQTWRELPPSTCSC